MIVTIKHNIYWVPQVTRGKQIFKLTRVTQVKKKKWEY